MSLQLAFTAMIWREKPWLDITAASRFETLLLSNRKCIEQRH